MNLCMVISLTYLNLLCINHVKILIILCIFKINPDFFLIIILMSFREERLLKKFEVPNAQILIHADANDPFTCDIAMLHS